MTSLISYFYATCASTQRWCVNNGVGTFSPFKRILPLHFLYAALGLSAPHTDRPRFSCAVCGRRLAEDASRDFVSAFFKSLAEAGAATSEPFDEMAEEAATPGGLNEQVHRGLVASGAYELVVDQLDAIAKRLTGADPALRPSRT